MTFLHTPVMTNEAVEGLGVRPQEWFVDATAGGGGHVDEILKRGGKVIAIDRDEDAIVHLQNKYKDNKNIRIVWANYSDIKEITKKVNIGNISGILFDLGYSSYQIEGSGRGFSFLRDEALDMRMDSRDLITAEDIVNSYQEGELSKIFLQFGEEEDSEMIASQIVRQRKKNRIKTTGELAGLIEKMKTRKSGKHPATKVFQALRIAVNNELDALITSIKGGFEVLEHGGRMVVITFHSLEDRVVKEAFLDLQKEGVGKIITKNPIFPTNEEIKKNRRSRSSKLRILEKI